MKQPRFVFALVLVLFTLACALPVPRVPTLEPLALIEPKDSTLDVDAAGAAQLDVVVRILKGDLTVQGIKGTVLRAQTRYNVAEWEPKLTSTPQTDGLQVKIQQGLGQELPLGADSQQYLYVSTVELPKDVPLSLTLDQGVGKAVLELSGVSLTSLGLTLGQADLSLTFKSVNPVPLTTLRLTNGSGKAYLSGLGNANFDRLNIIGGAGTLDVDFSGAWSRSALADIKAGVGKITLRFPTDLGVRVVLTSSSLTSLEAVGFTKTGENEYVNAAYGQAPLTLTVNLTTGVGTIELISQ